MPVPSCRQYVPLATDATSTRSDLLDQLAAFADKLCDMRLPLESVAAELPVLERVLISIWRARPARAAMHPAARLAADGGGLARRAFPGRRAAARAGAHRLRIAGMRLAHPPLPLLL